MEAYDWYDFVLDNLGGWNDVEEAGEVELGGQKISKLGLVAGLSNSRQLTEEASSAREMVCCALVMARVAVASRERR